MRYEKLTFVEKATKAWGSPLPDWVEALATEADRVTLTPLAARLEYSKAVLSYVIAKKYPGDVERVAEKVRGALLAATVMCPVYGEIGRDQCLDEQKKGNTFTNAGRGRCYRSCRGIGVPKCPNSRIPDGQR